MSDNDDTKKAFEERRRREWLENQPKRPDPERPMLRDAPEKPNPYENERR